MEKPSEEVLEKIFSHPDDLESVIEAFEEDCVEYLPHNLVNMLIENKLWQP